MVRRILLPVVELRPALCRCVQLCGVTRYRQPIIASLGQHRRAETQSTRIYRGLTTQEYHQTTLKVTERPTVAEGIAAEGISGLGDGVCRTAGVQSTQLCTFTVLPLSLTSDLPLCIPVLCDAHTGVCCVASFALPICHCAHFVTVLHSPIWFCVMRGLNSCYILETSETPES